MIKILLYTKSIFLAYLNQLSTVRYTSSDVHQSISRPAETEQKVPPSIKTKLGHLSREGTVDNYSPRIVDNLLPVLNGSLFSFDKNHLFVGLETILLSE